MAIQIRLAKPEELERLIELQSQALKVLSGNDYTEPEIAILIETQAQARQGYQEIVFVAEPEDCEQTTNNKIIGFACLSANSQEINGIYIHPDRARQKIGTKLLQAIEEVAITKQYRKLWVSSSLNAIQFYQANGYQKHFAYRLRLNKIPISVAIMSKQLIPLTQREKIIRRIVFAIAIFVILFVVVSIWNF
jgi:GNAT superfamily N-acetyltransferase